MAVQDVKAWKQGTLELHKDLLGNAIGYVGARSSQRVLSDLFCRGVSRGAVETTNLMVNGDSRDVVKAETFRTSSTVNMN
eukprot:7842785-Prorocentrum_lima.AAC.1